MDAPLSTTCALTLGSTRSSLSWCHKRNSTKLNQTKQTLVTKLVPSPLHPLNFYSHYSLSLSLSFISLSLLSLSLLSLFLSPSLLRSKGHVVSEDCFTHALLML